MPTWIIRDSMELINTRKRYFHVAQFSSYQEVQTPLPLTPWEVAWHNVAFFAHSRHQIVKDLNLAHLPIHVGSEKGKQNSYQIRWFTGKKTQESSQKIIFNKEETALTVVGIKLHKTEESLRQVNMNYLACSFSHPLLAALTSGT